MHVQPFVHADHMNIVICSRQLALATPVTPVSRMQLAS